jgi:hypothetical protein
MSHMHFMVWAATDKVDNNYNNITYLDIIADNPLAALNRAKALTKGLTPGKRYFHLQNVTEHHDHEVEIGVNNGHINSKAR